MAQTKKVTVELGFKANTEAVKKNINELAANLKQISNMQIGLKGSDLDQAKKAAKELGLELQKAVNVDTGRLDLNKLTSSLKKGHKDIVGLSSELLKAGPIGQKSFLQIAQAMSQAEVPMVKINQSLKDFMDNLGRNAKWHIAQMAIQGVQGSIQNAVREAEQLNKALNDIRIVTGYDKTVMAQFAKEANKAAKELKTTTKEYAEASLIFYQQGLSAAEVAKRAETVIKMSQVTGDTARAVSDQMTAIWNNFADGSKTLEYYADSMAKLGAETAASTSEIANGLEKFAAIAETVGLSYETAMASVATVIDKTRQSADVVGTAFKTIFARVQGLSMDGVTDDGVTLNKYSAALERVGVDVLTASGELRDMDEILNDLGAKWQLLGRESQVAVAQVVGGARQYNQLLSLMDNWSEVQSNILKAEGSTGEISKQANIWAESYEAASKRVEEAKARAAENFLNSEDVVNLTNAFADLITWVDKFIDSFGGVVPLALTITGLFSHKLLPIAKTGFTALGNNFKTFMGNALGTSEKLIKDTQNEFNNFLDAYKKGDIEDSLKAQIEWNQKLIKVKQDMAQITKYMSEQEKEKALSLLSVYEDNVQAAIRAQEAFREAEHEQKKAAYSFNAEEMKAAVSAQFFEDQDITDEGEQAEIRKAAQENVTKKLQIIKNKPNLEKSLKIAQSELATSQFVYDENKIKYEQALADRAKAERRLEIEKDTSYSGTRSGRVKKLEKRIADNTAIIEALRPLLERGEGEVTDKSKQVKNLFKQIQAAEAYEAEEEVLKQAEQLQSRRQAVTTRQGIQTAGFGLTQFGPDENITLDEQQRAFYNKKFTQAAQEKIDLRGQKVGLELETIKTVNKEGQEAEEQVIKNSIQNYEILRQKVIAYRVEAEKIAQVNKEILAELSEEEVEYFNALDARTEANAEKHQAQKLSALADTEVKQAEQKQQKAQTDEEKTVAAEQLNQAIKNREKAIKNLESATEKSAKAQERFKKAEEGVEKTSKKVFKNLQDNKKALIEIAKNAGLSEKELEEFIADLDKVDDIESFEKLRKQLKDFEITTKEAANSLKLASDTVQEALELKIDPAKIQQLAEAYNLTEKEALELAIAQKKAQEGAEEFGDKMSNFSNKFESIASGVGQATAAIGGMYAGVNQLIDAFDSGNTPMETFLGVLGGVVAIAPAVAMAFKAISAANSAYTKKKIADNTKEAGSEATTAGVKVTAEAAKHLASMNPAGIAAAAAAAVLLASIGIGAAVANSQANQDEQQRERNTASIEAAEKSNEIASATRTESQAIDELISQYNQLNAAQEDTTAIKEDIINQTDKVIEKYKEYADSVHMAADAQNELKIAIQELETAKTLGDITSIKKTQEKVDLLVAETAKEQNNLGIAGTLGNIGLKEDAKQVKAKDGYVQRQVGGAGAEEVKANKILQEAMGESVVKTRDRGTRIKLRTDSAEHFVEDYDKLQTAVDNMLKSGDSRVKDPNINDTLRECQELLSVYQEDYNSLKSQIATGAAYNAQIAIGNVAKTGHSVSNISKYTDYKKYKETVQNEINNSDLTDKEKSDALESLDSQLSANSELKNYTDLEKKLDIIAEKGTDARNRLESLLDGVNIEAALNVDYSVYSNEEDVIDEIDRQTNEIERQAAQKNIKAYSEISELLKPEDMTEEDWTKIAESDLFKDDPTAFTKFMNQSYGSQIAQLSKGKKEQEQAEISLLEANIKSYQQTLKTTNSAETWDVAKASLEVAQQELAIKLKVREAQQKYIADLRVSDIADIYHDINKELTQLEKQYRKIQQAQQDAYGPETIGLYDDLIQNIDEQNKKIEERIELNQEEVSFRQNKLVQKYQDDIGMDFQFDNNGNLLNYSDIAKTMLAKIQNEELNKTVWEEFEQEYGNYSSLVDSIYDDLDKKEENEHTKKELNFKKTTDTVDLTIEFNDMKLKDYQHKLEKALKGFSVEGKDLNLLTSQYNDMNTLLGDYNAELEELDRQYKNQEITEAEYVARLKENHDATYNNLQVLEQLKESVMNLYEESLSKASEEISKYTNKMEAAASTLEHYRTILGLLGEDYSDNMRAVVQGTETTAKDIFLASQSEYYFYKSRADEARQKLAEYEKNQGANLDKESDGYKNLLGDVEAAEEKEKEALDKMYTNAAEWAEAIRAKAEFEITAAAKTIEKSYLEAFKNAEDEIRFSSFDELLTQMERKSTLQEDFLTSTNKTYELNKMMNQLEKDSLKTDNVRSKQKLASFKADLENLQKSGKLSKAELDIKQKEYDLMLAEIALEEAQNAKSVVRLTRSADGSFGYVYTADENVTADAEQNRANAENALYNAKLETQNTYTQKSIQAQAQFHQEMEELTQQYINGEIESQEEFDRRKQDLWEYYSELVKDYSDVLSSELVNDSLVAKDAWSKDFQSMTTDISGWTNSITGEEGYFAKIQGALTTWATDLSSFKESIGPDFTDMSVSVGNITTKVDELKTALGDKDNGVIKNMSDFMETVNTWLTTNASTFLSNVSGLATNFEKLASNIREAYEEAKNANGLDVDTNGEGEEPKTIGTEKDGRKAAGKAEWKAAYNAALNGDDSYTITYSFDETHSEEFKQGYQKSIDEAIALGKAHREAGGITSTVENPLTSGAIYGSDITKGNITSTHDLAKDINDSYYQNLMKAKNGEVIDTNFISDNAKPIEEKESEKEKGLGPYGILSAFIQGNLSNCYGEKSKEILDQTLKSLPPETVKAFQALGQQVLANKNMDQINPILTEMIENEKFDIEALKKALSFDIAKQYMDQEKDVTVSYADWTARDGVLYGDPYFNFGHSKTYKVKELMNDSYVEPISNGEIRWAYTDNGTQTLRRYIISNQQIANLITAFDTGGYTGSWGPEGKMAMLHEKEIVLNKEDTVNLLESIKLLRSILGTIDLQAANAQLSSLTSGVFYPTSSSGEVLEQNVHIDAHFDSVTDRNEIVEAFDTLINRASQYANRKR